MGRFEQNKNAHGSLKDIQVLVNEKSALINMELKKYFKYDITVNWVSPLKNDNYSEYRDNDFLKVLGINKLDIPLNNFWPKNGPQWDALGKSNDKYFIVEAKANIPELKSPGTGASEKSIKLIEKSLNEVKKYLNIDSSFNWMEMYYQYINRIAHLYYLRVLNNLDAFLIFIYFLNDPTVNGPKSINEWENEIIELQNKIGLKNDNILSNYIFDIFVDYNHLDVI
jgi:hypothetical protein